MLEFNKDRIIWAILAVIVATTIGALIKVAFPEVITMVVDFFKSQITNGFVPNGTGLVSKGASWSPDGAIWFPLV